MRKLLFFAMLTPTLGPLFGQWIDYPTKGLPRTKDGKFDTKAAAPLLANGMPDFSGVWGTQFEQAACAGSGGCIEQMALPAIARHIGTYVKDGLPYTPDTAKLMEKRVKDMSKDDPHVRCTPPNFPRAWALPQYKRIVQQGDMLVILHEFQGSYRQIHMDGRPFPKDMHPAWSGYSTAHWEMEKGKPGKGRNAVLVVESRGFRDDAWLDMRGNPISSAAHVTERIRRPNYGTLEVEVTIDDPTHYTKPWTLHMDQWLIPDTDIIEEICVENEKDRAHLVGGGQ